MDTLAAKLNGPRAIAYGYAAFILLLFILIAFFAKQVGAGTPSFTYTLDDPLIHMRLSQQIAAGHYGINSNEFSSPSSSILWPILLVPFVHGQEFLLAPLAINAASVMALAIFVLWALPRAWSSLGKAAVLLLATNSIGLVFTGMEHNLQVFAAVLCAVGALRTESSGKVDPWFLGALVVGPLIRYESLSISLLLLLLWLLMKGHRLGPLLALGTLFTLIGAFSGFLHLHGLGWLPNSVVAKSDWSAGSPLHDLKMNFLVNFSKHYGFVFFVSGAFFLLTAEPLRRTGLGYVAAGCVLAHLFLGRFGWLDRYEVYLNGFLLMLAFGVRHQSLQWMRSHSFQLAPYGIFTAATALVCVHLYLPRLISIPQDAKNIASQQLQMHRFVDDYWKAPVGVNDLGWVSFNNPEFVLDLWGLGSSEALKRRLASRDTSWMAEVAKEHHVQLCMLFESWFGPLPKNWIKLGELVRVPGTKLKGFDSVSFFVTDPSVVSSTLRKLDQFAATLPPGSEFHFFRGRKDFGQKDRPEWPNWFKKVGTD